MQDIDKLFALYMKVQAAGFDGTEHVEKIKQKDCLFEDKEMFRAVYEAGSEDHHITFPGTRRGLRRLVRFAHIPALRKTFAKHKITQDEIETFRLLHDKDMRDPEKVGLSTQREAARVDIFKALETETKERDANFEDNLEGLCRKYQSLATKTALYNIQANSARMNDHVKLHQLVGRVVARLTDYALIWERDRLFALVGMLFCQKNAGELKLIRRSAERDGNADRIGLQVSNAVADNMRVSYESWNENDKPKGHVRAQLVADLDAAFIPFVDTEEGFNDAHFGLSPKILDENKAELFAHHFLRKKRTNPKDKDLPNPRSKATSREERKDIRNDLAHHNILDLANDHREHEKPNLTLVINAVRSLLSYDRKLKNAVSKSIKRILIEEGLFIRWEMQRDRLKRPIIYPMVEEHLTFVPKFKDDTKKSVVFTLPRASVRLVSMAKSVFDTSYEGYGRRQVVAGQTMRVAEYPRAFFATYPQTAEGVSSATRLFFASEND